MNQMYRVELIEHLNLYVRRPDPEGPFDSRQAKAECIRLTNERRLKTPTAPPQYVEPIFGIGTLTLGEGAETQWPNSGKVCRICKQSEGNGAMFTTIRKGDVCDDCLG